MPATITRGVYGLNRHFFPADTTGMGPSALILLNLVIAGLAITAVLYISGVRHMQDLLIHDLTIETHRLRNEYAARLEELRRGANERIELLSPGMSAPAGQDDRPAASTQRRAA